MILEMRRNSLSFQETCVLFKIPTLETLVKWVKIYDEEGPEGLSKENRGRSKPMPKTKKTYDVRSNS
ncbi:helix-turn-helix domain-containing protein [Salinimicrobium sp. TH3]|uniref:helix-turn-helix domain-containing protein n=1 Tax=Salinimicrobium sp. TH3 TaxID=2997342 RepID=UPI003FA398B5